MAKKTLQQLLETVGKNPKLVDELISKHSKNERIEVLIRHKVIASAADLPTRKDLDREAPELIVDADDQRELLLGAKVCWAFVVIGMSYE